jgi:hypothetical protein
MDERALSLPGSLRRLCTYLYLQDVVRGTVVSFGEADVRARKLLADQGATVVTELPGPKADVPDAQADVVLALDTAPDAIEATVAEAKRLLKPTGRLVLGCESRDRPGAKSGVSYFDLLDRVERAFARVTLIGLAPFTGATLVEYGIKEPEPMLDGSLVPKGERVEWYVAVAGQESTTAGGFAVIQVPRADSLPAQTAPALAPAPAPSPTPPPPPPPPAPSRDKVVEELRAALILHEKEMSDVRAQLRERDAYVTELEATARRGYVDAEAVRRADNRAILAEQKERQTRLQLAQIEGKLLMLTSRSTQSAAPAEVAPAAPAVVFEGDAGARITQLEAECARLRKKEEEARAEMWKHMKARSDAEAQATEVRDDTVRKLKDARKLASVELMRAMEEATRKAVSLREELERTTAEKKELQKELQAMREGVAAPIAVGPPPPAPHEDQTDGEAGVGAELGAAGAATGWQGGAAGEHRSPSDLERARAAEEHEAQVRAVRARAERERHDEEVARAAAEVAERQASERVEALHNRLVALERELADAERRAEGERERAAQLGELVRKLEAKVRESEAQAYSGAAQQGAALDAAQADRERLSRMLSDVEVEASKRADAAVRVQKGLREREREVEALRRELAERDSRIVALEKLHPPADEVSRMEAELAQARAKVAEVTLEVARRDAAVDQARAAAAHERARAERLVAEERRALQERNEARAHAAESDAQTAAAAAELERTRREREIESERARHAEGEARERKERVKQLKRELESAERRVARLAAAEGVAERLRGVEASLRGEEQRLLRIEDALRQAAVLAGPQGS